MKQQCFCIVDGNTGEVEECHICIINDGLAKAVDGLIQWIEFESHDPRDQMALSDEVDAQLVATIYMEYRRRFIDVSPRTRAPEACGDPPTAA